MKKTAACFCLLFSFIIGCKQKQDPPIQSCVVNTFDLGLKEERFNEQLPNIALCIRSEGQYMPKVEKTDAFAIQEFRAYTIPIKYDSAGGKKEMLKAFIIKGIYIQHLGFIELKAAINNHRATYETNGFFVEEWKFENKKMRDSCLAIEAMAFRLKGDGPPRSSTLRKLFYGNNMYLIGCHSKAYLPIVETYVQKIRAILLATNKLKPLL